MLLKQKDKIKKWGKGKFVWSITNMIRMDDEGTEGEGMVLDAVTGEYLYSSMEIGTW